MIWVSGVHFKSELQRRPLLHKLIQQAKAAYWIEPGEDGQMREICIASRLLS